MQKDLEKALRYFRAAAAQGLSPAIYNVGVYYEQGRSVDQALAQAKVGAFYLNGIGTHRDAVAARSWFDLSAKQGFVPAQTQLGLLYEQGVGVERNLRTAAQLFSLASDRGDVGATLKLASYYADGIGVEADLVKAYTLSGSVAENSEQAAALQAKIKGQLTGAQVAEADKAIADIKAGRKRGTARAAAE